MKLIMSELGYDFGKRYDNLHGDQVNRSIDVKLTVEFTTVGNFEEFWDNPEPLAKMVFGELLERIGGPESTINI